MLRARPGRNDCSAGRSSKSWAWRVGDELEIGAEAATRRRHLHQWRLGVRDRNLVRPATSCWNNSIATEPTARSCWPTADAATAEQVAERLTDSRRLSIEAQPEPAYYLEQAEQTESLAQAGITVALFMGIGAMFGITNTMFAAIEQRTKDIAVLRLLGFRKQEILISFLVEALLIALIGGCGQSAWATA